MIVLPLAYFSMSLDIESLTPLELEAVCIFVAVQEKGGSDWLINDHGHQSVLGQNQLWRQNASKSRLEYIASAAKLSSDICTIWKFWCTERNNNQSQSVSEFHWRQYIYITQLLHYRPDLYEKIVTKKMGGWCFHLNGLFQWLLCELGFSVELTGSSIHRFDLGGTWENPNHVVLLVHINKQAYLTDVGVGMYRVNKWQLGVVNVDELRSLHVSDAIWSYCDIWWVNLRTAQWSLHDT